MTAYDRTIQSLGNIILNPSQDSVTALAGGGQTSATPITAPFARVTTVATAGGLREAAGLARRL